MFFRIVAGALAAGAAALWFSGCGLKTGEKAPEQNPPSFNGKNYGCVGQIPQNIGRYANDELNEAQITDFVRCLQKAFTTFAQLTRGRDQESYAPEEIRRFLQTYFFKERPISQQLTHEFMVLKQVLVGGEVGLISRPELASLIELLEDVRREAIRLKPHVRFLNPALVVNQDPADVGHRLTEANQALKASVKVIAARLQGGKREYPFENLGRLMSEFRNFVRWDETFKEAHPVPSWINFFKVFKSTAVNPEAPEVIRPEDWSHFLGSLSRWYLAFIQYEVGVKEKPLLYGAGLQNTEHLARELFDLTEIAVSRQRGKTLSMLQLSTLATAVQDMRWMSPNIRVQSVEKVLGAMLNRMFADETASFDGYRANGLDLKALSLMKQEFYRWYYIQQQLNQSFNAQALLHESNRKRVPNLQMPGLFNPRDLRASWRHMRDADWEHFLRVKTLTRPLFNDNLSRVTLVPNEDLERFRLSHEFNNLSMMNLFRSAVGIMFRGYASEARRRMDWAAGLKTEEVQRFYDDVRDLLIDLALADRRNVNVGSRAFLEGNLFTYSADGVALDQSKSRLTFVESMELLAFLYSGGKTSTDFYTKLVGICEKGGGLDLNGEAKVSHNCVKKELATLISEFGLNMPGLADYIRTAPQASQETLVKNLIGSARSPKTADPNWVERSELATMAVVLHYMEAVLTRYDADRDGVLTHREIRRAMPVFVGFIQRFARDRMKLELSEAEANGVFLYIMKYKQVPEPGSWLDFFSVGNLMADNYEMYWEFNIRGVKVKIDLNTQLALNRAELSTVFRVIVAKIFDTSPAERPVQAEAADPAREQCQMPEFASAWGCGALSP